MRLILKILSLVITLPIIAVSASFAVTNTHDIVLGLWPFDVEIGVPAALLLFIVLLSGFFLGAIASYLGAASLRRRARRAEFQVRQFEIDAARERRESEAATDSSSTAVALSGSTRSPVPAE